MWNFNQYYNNEKDGGAGLRATNDSFDSPFPVKINHPVLSILFLINGDIIYL